MTILTKLGAVKLLKALHFYSASSRRTASNDHLFYKNLGSDLYKKKLIPDFYKTTCSKFICVS